jgi:hypothetical protein
MFCKCCTFFLELLVIASHVGATFSSERMNTLRLSPFALGRAIAQAVSRWLPTAAARVRARVLSNGICGGQSGTGAGFLQVLRFPLPIFIPPISPLSYSPGAGKIDHSVADVPSGPRLDSTPHYAN